MLSLSRLFLAAFQVSVDDGDKGGENNDADDKVQIFLDVGYGPSKEVASEHGQQYPEYAPNDIVEGKFLVAHRCDAGNSRGEGSHNRDESADHNGLGAMLVIERVRFSQMLFPKEKRVYPLIEDLPCLVADMVIELVAGKGAKSRKEKERPKVKISRCREDASGDKERVPREEESKE